MTRSTLHRNKSETIGETPAAGSEKSYATAFSDKAELEVSLFQIEAIGESLQELFERLPMDPAHERPRLLASTIVRLCHTALCDAGCR
ncbi:hypothetical protein [Lysobacter antibioticus]|uniref:hypothetical protein n=1 Tax=Lysobacter antibioticus TaxID=84531 RepID=UPI0007E8D7CF|nr:hypothetical protein [Lysobacter antibioticus]